MRKLLLSIISISNAAAYVSALDMNNLKCKDMNITDKTTLKKIQDNCLIKEQKPYRGMFEVVFQNDATEDYVKCDFATDRADSIVNGCR